MSNELGMIPTVTTISGIHFIVGTSESLESLGHALIAKAKLQERLDVTLNDGMNVPGKILTASEALCK